MNPVCCWVIWEERRNSNGICVFTCILVCVCVCLCMSVCVGWGGGQLPSYDRKNVRKLSNLITKEQPACILCLATLKALGSSVLASVRRVFPFLGCGIAADTFIG